MPWPSITVDAWTWGAPGDAAVIDAHHLDLRPRGGMSSLPTSFEGRGETSLSKERFLHHVDSAAGYDAAKVHQALESLLAETKKNVAMIKEGLSKRQALMDLREQEAPARIRAEAEKILAKQGWPQEAKLSEASAGPVAALISAVSPLLPKQPEKSVAASPSLGVKPFDPVVRCANREVIWRSFL
mmetsp:Transcript_43261/g.80525  ORF Transcript_43261/g.80525 Transcript_43261/m.80525 type:complete len:185 (-) Transcript_43261:1-555(-)